MPLAFLMEDQGCFIAEHAVTVEAEDDLLLLQRS
jgi:hypothetical protein